MEDQHDAALLERANSADTVTEPRRNANVKAFKVAGLTLLACLLLAGQALTAYFILGQRDHISALEQGQENLKNQLITRGSSGSPKKMHVPINSMPLLTALTDDESPKQKVPLTRLQSTSFQREGSGLIDGTRLAPRRMLRPMNTLPILAEFGDEKAEESTITESPAMEVETKCKLESEKQVKPGFFRPQCDEKGNYLPMQCWHSTGYCWCVDKNGNEIEGTLMRGRPHCGDVNEKLD
ncbi:CD74 molecule, major histocompatibility complex, class II invariant chain a [Colossoma macropomum]|uniref:CD74 molecule, major histocompatibility complex, class II invariant chain a n=1 Tax=Colossoma macropomum TaxID=42526 RepID=UPI0018648CDF|nr:CD74 molecule, major histocompatibility complex, class II invariant chain a [Colossoma macropomum]